MTELPASIECFSCGGNADWHDEAWVCDDCGDEWYPDESDTSANAQPDDAAPDHVWPNRTLS